MTDITIINEDYVSGYSDCLDEFEDRIDTAVRGHLNGEIDMPSMVDCFNEIVAGLHFIKLELHDIQGELESPCADCVHNRGGQQ